MVRVPSSSSRGFTLVEVVVALAVILILAAVALPNVVGYMDQKRVESAATQLALVRDALYNTASGATAFRQRVTSNAGRLSQLSSAIVANDANYATGSDDSCGTTFTTTQRNNWLTYGPFVNFVIDRDHGMATPIGTAVDSLTRVPNSASAGRLRLNFVNSVDSVDAAMLDNEMDGGDGMSAGSVQWLTPATNGVVTMYYFVNIDATC